jgi:hypothetical protein
MCDVLLLPGVNPTAVKYIYIYICRYINVQAHLDTGVLFNIASYKDLPHKTRGPAVLKLSPHDDVSKLHGLQTELPTQHTRLDGPRLQLS